MISPLIAIEVVSGDGRAEHDQTPESGQFWIYERAIQSPYFIIHSFRTDEVEVYEHVRGRYRRLELKEDT